MSTPIITCPKCGTSVQADATFCSECGYSLSSSAFSDYTVPISSLGLNKESIHEISTEIEVPSAPPTINSASTKLQAPAASVLHVQTNTTHFLPESHPVIFIGRANDHRVPDIDVTDFPDGDVVSRIHAKIYTENGFYYVEDLGSANGTYLNSKPLRPKTRNLLQVGDRISLGKQEKVSFVFQIS